jgi:hypothetical protein
MTKPMYSICAYGFPGHPFPKFWDSYPTLRHARAAANQAHKEGWRLLEIFKDMPLPEGHTIGANRVMIEIIGE